MMLLHARPRYRKGKVYAPPLCTVLLSSAARALCWTPFMDLGFIWLFYLVLLNQTWQNNLFVNLWTCTHSCLGSCTHVFLWFMDVGILHVKFIFEVGGWVKNSQSCAFIAHAPTHPPHLGCKNSITKTHMNMHRTQTWGFAFHVWQDWYYTWSALHDVWKLVHARL